MYLLQNVSLVLYYKKYNLNLYYRYKIGRDDLIFYLLQEIFLDEY